MQDGINAKFKPFILWNDGADHDARTEEARVGWEDLIENQLPDLIVGILTRESLYAAFDCGITAEQIIEFLSKNAHPRIANRESAVPANVTDQLKLWEREKNRVDITPACIYTDFPTQGFFERSVKHARETKALLWKHSERTQLVVIQEKDNEMRTFMKANAASCK